MRDWDTRISELKKNIEAARNRFVIPFLDSKYLEEQVVKDIKSKPTVNEKSETKEIDKNEETKDSKKTTDKDTQSVQPSQEEQVIEAKEEVKEQVEASEAPSKEVKEENVEEVQKLDTDQVDAMLDEVTSKDTTPEEAEIIEAKEEVKDEFEDAEVP